MNNTKHTATECKVQKLAEKWAKENNARIIYPNKSGKQSPSDYNIQKTKCGGYVMHYSHEDQWVEHVVQDLERENNKLVNTAEANDKRINDLEWYIKDLLQAHGARVLLDEYVERGVELLANKGAK